MLDDRIHAGEPLRRDADNRHRRVGNLQRPTDHGGIARELVHPEPVAQHCDRVAPLDISLFGKKSSPKHGLDSQRIEEVAADAHAHPHLGQLIRRLGHRQQREAMGDEPGLRSVATAMRVPAAR